MSPQFAWEENALSLTERITGVKRLSTEPYIPTSVFPPENITGIKTRTYQSLISQGIEPLTPAFDYLCKKPEDIYDRILKQQSLIDQMRERTKPKTFMLSKPRKASEPEFFSFSARTPPPLINYLKISQESKVDKMLREIRELPILTSKSWETNPFSGVSSPFTTKRGTTLYPDTDLWSKTLGDGSYLIGERGSGTHTHMGTDRTTGKEFVSIKDEKKGKSVFRTLVDWIKTI